MFVYHVSQKLRRFLYEIFKLLRLPDVLNIRFCGHNGHISSKLEVCLPLAYTSTIYKHFSSLMTLGHCIY